MLNSAGVSSLSSHLIKIGCTTDKTRKLRANAHNPLLEDIASHQ